MRACIVSCIYTRRPLLAGLIQRNEQAIRTVNNVTTFHAFAADQREAGMDHVGSVLTLIAAALELCPALFISAVNVSLVSRLVLSFGCHLTF